MALLDIFGTTPSYYGGLLGEDELNRVRQQAQQQALQNTALALLQAGAPSRTPGNEALAIAQGLAGGQQAYKQTMQEGLQNKMQEMQIQDYMRKQPPASHFYIFRLLCQRCPHVCSTTGAGNRQPTYK